MPPAWSIVEYSGRDGLMSLKADWTRLVAAMPDAGLQHLYETHLSCVVKLPSALGPLTCLALSDGTRVRAIFPVDPQYLAVFRIFKEPVWGLLKGLEDIPRDVICPPDPEAEAALFPCVVEHLRRKRPRLRWLVLTRVIEGSVAWRCLSCSIAPRYYADRDGTAHIVDSDRPFAELTAALSRKFRRNLRAAHNRLARLPDVRFVRAVDPNDVGTAFDRFLNVEASGWKGEAGTGNAIAPRLRYLAFYRDWVASLAAAGRCEFNELRSGDTCLASTFCIRAGEQCAVLNIGYDERFANVAPGQIVLERIIRQCCEDPSVRRVNLVSGSAWTLVWQPQVMRSFTIYVAIGGWSSRIRLGLLRASFLCWPKVKRWLKGARVGRWVVRKLTGG